MTTTIQTVPSHTSRFAIRPLQGLRGIPRQTLVPEMIAGITLAALAIPLNIGYASVAGLPPIVGLYAAIFPMIFFAIFTSSRQLVASPDAPIAALIASLLSVFAAPTDAIYLQYAYAQAIVCGIIFFLFWLFRLGFLANFLSRAVLIGFISGLGIEVFTNQIEKIMGVSVEAQGWLREVFALFQSIPQANWYSVAIGVGTIVIIRLLKRFAPRLPGALIALIIMTAVVAVFQLNDKGVAVLGTVEAGLPTVTIPQIPPQDFLTLAIGGLAICAVTMADGLLVGRNFAQKRGYPIDANQEMFTFGVANVASGLTGGFAVGASASRTAAMDDSGARSQIPSLVCAAVVALVLLFFSDLLAMLPTAALGGIVANAVLKLIEVGDLRELFRVRRSEFVVAMVCLLTVLFVGSLAGVVFGFLFSIIDLMRRAAAPRNAVLGEVEGEYAFLPVGQSHGAITLPGLLVYRFGGQLFFANSEHFQAEITALVDAAQPPLRMFVLSADMIADIDSTGAETLRQVVRMVKQRGIRFVMTHVESGVMEELERYELVEAIGEANFYATNRDAERAYQMMENRDTHL